MKQTINEYLSLNTLEQVENGYIYQIVATMTGVVQHQFYVPAGAPVSPLEIANQLAADDWFEIDSNNDLECSLNFQYDQLGIYYIVESEGLTKETRSFDEAQSWYLEVKSKYRE